VVKLLPVSKHGFVSYFPFNFQKWRAFYLSESKDQNKNKTTNILLLNFSTNDLLIHIVIIIFAYVQNLFENFNSISVKIRTGVRRKPISWLYNNQVRAMQSNFA
jgi:hypothetical protein